MRDRQPVQPGARPADLGRPGQLGPGRQVAGGQPVGGAGHGAQRAHQGPGQLVGDGDAEHQQPEADAAEQQPGAGHPVAQLRVRHEGPDHRGAVGQALHRHQDLDPARARPR